MKVVTILGTRPEIIKLASLLPLLNQETNHVLIHSGQHYDFEMDQAFFSELKLTQPKYNLRVGSAQQGVQTAKMMQKIEEILIHEKPDLVIVQGDTNTTLAGALCAAKLHVPLAHVEAGCRSFNKKMPEEINRIVADHCSTLLFAADQESVFHLAKEGITENVHNVGNTIFDACLRNKEIARDSNIIGKIGLASQEFIVATIHRAQSTDNKETLSNIVSALNEIAEKIDVVIPLHPRTKKALENHDIKLSSRVKVLPPISYLPFLKLLSHARFIISDSGGIQDEALVFNVPCLIPRKETEWTRLVDAGKNFLVGNTKESILYKAFQLIENPQELTRIKAIEYPYETGVAERIISITKKYFEEREKNGKQA